MKLAQWHWEHMPVIEQPKSFLRGRPGAAWSTHSVELDVLRGLSALLVVAFHARVLFFVNRAEAGDAGLGIDLFYLITAFGRDAVCAFFVLSGYLIASSMQRDQAARRWSPTGYAVARLSRLYVVFIPALAVGLAWDGLGLRLFGDAAVYTGRLANGEFPLQVAANIGWANVLGALGFVQAIVVNAPGSSQQYWSLAYEFWCYALFPLVFLALVRGAVWQRVLWLAIAVAVAAWLGRDVISYLGIWLLGAAVALWPKAISPLQGRVLLAAGVAAIVGITYLILGQGLRMPHAGFGLAAGFALLIAGSKALDRPMPDAGARRWYARGATWLADRSYSLYAIHVPPLVLLRAWCGDQLWQPTPMHLLAWLGLIGACVLYAHLFWLVSERHTPRVRRWLARLLGSGKPVSAPQLRASS
jgi:peptidoglycan/LPS O-acetylase OafA/YrhL